MTEGTHYRAKVKDILICKESFEPKITFKKEVSADNSMCAFFKNSKYDFICAYSYKTLQGKVEIDQYFKDIINGKAPAPILWRKIKMSFELRKITSMALTKCQLLTL